jgi:signal transduction histidine kinase
MGMISKAKGTGPLRHQELEAVYAISRAAAQAENIESALDEIIRISRPVFIFDHIVLYQPKADNVLEPTYARVVGRGQSAEGNLAWGEAVAHEVYQTGQTLKRQEQLEGWQNDRLSLRFFLGLPLTQGERVMGALVFGRFGGPPYSPDQIYLAEFIGDHVAQLLGHKQLVERIANLEAEKRLEELQHDFIATVTHELNTPLGFIKGYATTLLRDDINWDEITRREFLNIIDEEADRLRELIDHLLDSSRLQSGTLRMHFQLVRLDSLLRDISVRARSRNENLNIYLNIKQLNLRCQADPTRIAQVIDNLLSNAAKYAPGAPVIISLDVTDNKAHIAVRDKGPGIAPEHVPSLFNRFYRVPDKSATARGTGLGLFICRQIVNAHGGEISVESTLGEGTIFHIYLPISTQRTEPIPSELSSAEQSSTEQSPTKEEATT